MPLTGAGRTVQTFNMEPFYRAVLSSHLSDRQRRNSRYSLRAFAKQLEISPGQLSGLMSGKKKLTTKQAVKIIEKLELTEQESSDLLRGLHPGLQTKESSSNDHQQLSEDEFKLISEWYHFAILSLGKIPGNHATARWVSEQLAIDFSVAQAAMLRLQRMGFISIEGGHFRQTSKPLTTTTEVPSRAIRDYHLQNLKIAAEKLETVEVGLRQFASVTMAVNPRSLARAKRMISDFNVRMCDELETKDASQVYTLAVQLFPLTRTNSEVQK